MIVIEELEYVDSLAFQNSCRYLQILHDNNSILFHRHKCQQLSMIRFNILLHLPDRLEENIREFESDMSEWTDITKAEKKECKRTIRETMLDSLNSTYFDIHPDQGTRYVPYVYAFSLMYYRDSYIDIQDLLAVFKVVDNWTYLTVDESRELLWLCQNNNLYNEIYRILSPAGENIGFINRWTDLLSRPAVVQLLSEGIISRIKKIESSFPWNDDSEYRPPEMNNLHTSRDRQMTRSMLASTIHNK